MKDSMYGYTVGKVYKTKMQTEDEYGQLIPVGTLIRLISIAPKVRIIKGFRNTDSKSYFYNAVLADNDKDYPRIRQNFCTISHKII